MIILFRVGLLSEMAKKVQTKKLVWGIDPINHLGSIWYHSEPLERGLVIHKPVTWLGLFLLFLKANQLQRRVPFATYQL